MKTIELKPSKIEFKSLAGGEVIADGKPIVKTFKEFLLERLADARFSATAEDVFVALEIKNKIDEIDENSETLELEDAHYNKLKDVVKNPSTQNPLAFHPAVSFNIVPWLKAILNADRE